MTPKITIRELHKRGREMLRRHRFTGAEAAVAAFRGAASIDVDRFRADPDQAAGQDSAPRT